MSRKRGKRGLRLGAHHGAILASSESGAAVVADEGGDLRIVWIKTSGAAVDIYLRTKERWIDNDPIDAGHQQTQLLRDGVELFRN